MNATRIMQWFSFLSLGALLLGQGTTDINVSATQLQPTVKRLGINLGSLTNYDSAQMMKNLLFVNNPGFEPRLFQSIIRCTGTSSQTSCVDENIYSGWPNGFWTGASFEFISGPAAGRTGTIPAFTGNTGSGGVFTLSPSGTVPGAGSYMIVRLLKPGDAHSGWMVLNNGGGSSTVGNGTIGSNTSDLSTPGGSRGVQTVVLTAPTSADKATIVSYFDDKQGTGTGTYVNLNGSYRLWFNGKGTQGSRAVKVTVTRLGANSTPSINYIDTTVNLTASWQPYSIDFSAAETGAQVEKVKVSLETVGQDTILLDDINLIQLNTDPTNPTVFRDPVVNTLKELKPGVLRFWAYQLADTLENLIAPPYSRMVSSYSAYLPDNSGTPRPWTNNSRSYSLPEFLQLCQLIGAEPWVVVPMTFTPGEAAGLIDYLAGDGTTYYGQRRINAGFVTPWADPSVFSKIHLEFGNENWNGGFNGGGIQDANAYGQRAQAIFAAMRSRPSYQASRFNLILGGQAVNAGLNSTIQAACNNNDTFAVAPYMMSNVNNFATNEELFGSAFAEAEVLESNTGSSQNAVGAQGQTVGGMIYLNRLAIPTKPLATYEANIHTTGGTISQAALDGFTPSVGAGLAVVDSMLQQMRNGMILQNLYTLAQNKFTLPDYVRSAKLWGSVVDMGATNRKRPVFQALQMVNEAIAPNNTAMVKTTHTGSNPVWASTHNTVQLSNAHYLQSFAFDSGTSLSLIVFNLHRSASQTVTLSGCYPSGTVTRRQLASANITDNNEQSALVSPVSSTLPNFNPASPLSLPPFSMTVLSGTKACAAPGPAITNVATSAIGAVSATVTWTSSQPSTSRVNYGPTTAYGSQTNLDSALVTAHTATLTGLTPSTTYNFQVVSANASGGSTTSANFTFQTAAGQPIVVLNGTPATWPVGSTTANILWTTTTAQQTDPNWANQPSTSEVTYWTSTTAPTQVLRDMTAPTTWHNVPLTGLTPNTIYSFTARSVTSSGTSVTWSGSFTTTP